MQTRSFYAERHEKYHVLTTETPVWILMICGVLATALFFGISLYVAGLFFDKKVFTLIDPARGSEGLFAVAGILSLVIGMLGSQIRRFEYISMDLSYRKSEFFKLSFYLLYVLFFFFVAYFAFLYFLPMWQASSGKDFWTLFPVVLLLAVLAAWLVRNVWDILFRFWLMLFSPIDWRLIVDRRHFEQMMKIKFAEVMRYQGPLSMMVVGIKNFDEIKKRFGTRRVKRLQYRIVDLINASVRNLDLVGRIEAGQFIAALLHTAGMEARVPAQRILERMADLAFFARGGSKVPVHFCFGIASYEQSMESEQELITKAKTALREAMEGDKEIVYL